MRGQIISDLILAGILYKILLFSMLRLPVNIAAFIAKPNCSFDDCAFLDDTANWIVYFLNECHTNAETPLIVAGNLTDKMIQKIHHSSKVSQVLFTEVKTWSKDFYEKYCFRFQYKARIFLVATKSQPLLDHLIKQLKSSRWWNVCGHFLILDEKPKNSACRNARHYLSTAWSNGLLSAVYLCLRNSTQNLNLYSYNPFEDQAPRPDWETIASNDTERDGHSWTLLRLDVGKFSDKFNCDRIFFDKTRSLGGYPIRINALHLPPTLVIEAGKNISGLDKYSGEDGRLAKTLWKWLNATIIEVPQAGNWGMGFTDEQGIKHGTKMDVKNGRIDISLNHRYMLTSRDLEATYPHIWNTYCFLTKRQGTFPLWRNLMLSINPSVGFLILVFILTVILLLTIITDKKYTVLLFNVLRILVSAPMLKIPRKFTARFILASVLLLFSIVYGIFEVQISAIVTKPKNYKNFETLDELGVSDYEIYGYIGFAGIVGTIPQIKDRFIASVSDEQCFNLAMDNKPVACTDDCMRLWQKSAEEHEFHVAREPMGSNYAHFVTRIDWPILDRVNQIIARMVSAGLPEYWRRQTLWRVVIKNVVEMRNIKSVSEPLPIKFNDLEAIFYALMMGLILATLTFGLELGFFRWKNK